MIHDRFYSQWQQPTSVVSSDQKFVTTVAIRIQKDGSISTVSLANSSGNVIMDESVMAAAQRVTQIDPLPAGLGGDYYDVKINFELEQH
jgi:TonB family protein